MAEVSWVTKLGMALWPKAWLRAVAARRGVDSRRLDWAAELFHDSRIDLFPLSSQRGRGFLVVIDSKLSLWFVQDGDHFVFDGHEMGEYSPGRVTIFDGMKDHPSPFA